MATQIGATNMASLAAAAGAASSSAAWGALAFIAFAVSLDALTGGRALRWVAGAVAGVRAHRAENARLLALGKALTRGGPKARIARDGSVIVPPPPPPPPVAPAATAATTTAAAAAAAAAPAAGVTTGPRTNRRFLGFEDGDTARKVMREFKRMRVQYVIPATLISVFICVLGVAKPYLTGGCAQQRCSRYLAHHSLPRRSGDTTDCRHAGNMFDVVAHGSGATMTSVYPILVNLALIQVCPRVAPPCGCTESSLPARGNSWGAAVQLAGEHRDRSAVCARAVVHVYGDAGFVFQNAPDSGHGVLRQYRVI
jgi:hypothetical protein